MVIFFTVALALVVVSGGLYNFGLVDKGITQDPTPPCTGTLKISGSASPHYLVNNLSQHGTGAGNPLSGAKYIGTSVPGNVSSSPLKDSVISPSPGNKYPLNRTGWNSPLKPGNYQYPSIKYPGALPSPVIPAVIPTLIPVSPTVSPVRVIVDNSTREVEQRIFYYTNLERVSVGESAYTWDEKLATIARDDCVDMATRNFFNHINPDGETPADRAARHGYPTQKDFGSYTRYGVGENIAMLGNYPGTPDDIARFIVKAWMESPDHRANILDLGNSKYTNLGVGVAYNADTDTWYAAQEFF